MGHNNRFVPRRGNNTFFWKIKYWNWSYHQLWLSKLYSNIYIYIYIYIWLTISPCYGSIPLALGLIGRDGGLSSLCHSCGFACRQRVLRTFPGTGYLRSEDGVVWLWHSLINLCIYIYIYIISKLNNRVITVSKCSITRAL